MKLSAYANNSGISLTIGEGDSPPRRQRNPHTDQSNPRPTYVYGHFDSKGTPFYIGAGVGRRAWDGTRHYLWHRYVDKHLSGQYRVVILEDDLSQEQADRAESEWMAQESDTLVNWVNMSRGGDFAALDRFHRLRNANRSAFEEARQYEKTDMPRAVHCYQKCIARLAGYAGIHGSVGLVGRLLDEDNEEHGIAGELVMLDRLTLCLLKLNRPQEAIAAADAYFALYRRDVPMTTAKAIRKRLSKAADMAG